MQMIETHKTVRVPEDVDVNVDGRIVTVRGKKGELTRDFSHTPISILSEGKMITVQANWPRKKEAALVGTVCSHLQNMITGVTKGFIYKMKIVFSHFPISVKVRERKILIDNFTGERSSRIAKIMGDTRVTVEDEDIIVQGIDIEDVSQTSANIAKATKIRRKDPRVFLDGIYVYERHEGTDT